MKKLTALFMTLLCFNLFAQTEDKVSMKEIKAYLQTINTDATCLDEYVKRRSQLVVKLSLSPVIIAAGAASSTAVAGATTAAIVTAMNVEAWGAIGYTVGGAALGLATGAASTIGDTVATALVLKNTDMILKAIAEQQMGLEDLKGDQLYKRYIKRSKLEISKEDFLAKLLAADANGSLCDGSMVKQPRIRLNTKLSYKVAKLKDIIRELN